MRHYVFDLGLTALSSASEKLLIQECYEKCGIGKDDLGRQRVIDVCMDIFTQIFTQVCATLTTAELDHELDWISPVHSPHDRDG